MFQKRKSIVALQKLKTIRQLEGKRSTSWSYLDCRILRHKRILHSRIESSRYYKPRPGRNFVYVFAMMFVFQLLERTLSTSLSRQDSGILHRTHIRHLRSACAIYGKQPHRSR